MVERDVARFRGVVEPPIGVFLDDDRLVRSLVLLGQPTVSWVGHPRRARLTPGLSMAQRNSATCERSRRRRECARRGAPKRTASGGAAGRLPRPLGAAARPLGGRRRRLRTCRADGRPKPPRRERTAAVPPRRAEPAGLPPRRGAVGLRPGAARGAAGRRARLSLEPAPRRRRRRARPGPRPHRDRARDRAPVCPRRSRGIEIWQNAPLPPHRSPTRRRSGARARRGCSTSARRPRRRTPQGPPVLVAPSLINRAYVLDLAPRWSMLRGLAAAGPAPGAARLGRPGPRRGGLHARRLRRAPAGAGAAPPARGRAAGRWR